MAGGVYHANIGPPMYNLYIENIILLCYFPEGQISCLSAVDQNAAENVSIATLKKNNNMLLNIGMQYALHKISSV